MTHRLSWAWELGTDWIAEIDETEEELMWYKFEEYVEEWGPSYSGRTLSYNFGGGNDDDNKVRHGWDLKVKNSKQFKIGHENLVKRLKKNLMDEKSLWVLMISMVQMEQLIG